MPEFDEALELVFVYLFPKSSVGIAEQPTLTTKQKFSSARVSTPTVVSPSISIPAIVVSPNSLTGAVG
ncbi:MAG: hypothetical protein F4082_07200 [Gammaproteobacteria bacterium]|nr:hypothetical protein [Gammaproteobacteria bacterium]